MNENDFNLNDLDSQSQWDDLLHNDSQDQEYKQARAPEHSYGVYVQGNYYQGDNMRNQNIYHNRKEPDEVDPRDACRWVTLNLIRQEIISYKQDFVYLYKLELEMSAMGMDSWARMVKFFKTFNSLPDRLMPSDSTIKKVNLGNQEYPKWETDGLDIGTLSHRRTVAEAYIKGMAKYGYSHPYLKKQAESSAPKNDGFRY